MVADQSDVIISGTYFSSIVLLYTFLCVVHSVQVTLQKLDKGGNISSERNRSHVGTAYFEAGTTVNDVLTFVSERQRKTTGGTGLWLLQTTSGKCW